MPLDPLLPEDFPKSPYAEVQKRVSVDLGEAHPEARREFAGGWNGLRYRYMACCEHDHGFTQSIQSGQNPLERYHQERDLFGFFVAGQSAIESLCYGLYAIASVVQPSQFPIQTQHHLKGISWRKTSQLYSSVFPNDGLATVLEGLVQSSQFSTWREQRNILAHRSTPGRVINLGGPLNGITEWSGIELNQTTTTTRRGWLAKTIGDILNEADGFTAKYILTDGTVQPA